MTTKLDAALELTSFGWPVFPVVENGKKPACAHGFLEATLDVARITAWWAENPNYNIGLSPDPAGLVVLDLDGEVGKANWEKFSTDNNLKETTWTVQTPHGFHLYFEGSLPSSVCKLADKVDIRGRGGYVVAPGSIIDGVEYVPLDPDATLATLPGAILDAVLAGATESHHPIETGTTDLDAERNRNRARNRLLDMVGSGDIARAGHGGNDLSYRVIAAIRDMGLTPGVSRELLEEIWNPACIPPWSKDELTTLVDNVYNHAQNALGAKALPSGAEVFENVVLPAKPKNRFMTVAEMATMPDPVYLLQDVLMEQSSALFVGAWKSYKSFLALDMALCIATGETTALGIKPARVGPVIYSCREGMAGIAKSRRRAWCVAHNMDPDAPMPFFLGPSPLARDVGDCNQFITDAGAIAGKPALIVIDTVARTMAGLDETRDVALLLELTDRIVGELDTCALLLHHFGHDTTRGARGGTAFPAGFDTVLYGESKGARRVEIKVEKMKDAEERAAPFTMQGRKVGTSLVFYPTTSAEHIAGIAAADPFAREAVGAVLETMNCYDTEGQVSTSVLAGHMFPIGTDEQPEEHQIRLDNAVKTLDRLARTKLNTYCVNSGTGARWHLPPVQW